MYQNESFDEYIRSVLGYPSLSNMQTQNYMGTDMVDYYGRNNMNAMQTDDAELEECYPEIYKLVYPMILKRCDQIAEPVTRDTINRITNEIYNAIEVTNEVNVNINLQNEVSNNRQEQKVATKQMQNQIETNNIVKNTGGNEQNRSDNRQEDRQFRNRNLRDLIQILLIRELLRRRHQGRPPFPGRRWWNETRKTTVPWTEV